MDRKADGEGSESRFASYVEHIASTLGHAGSCPLAWCSSAAARTLSGKGRVGQMTMAGNPTTGSSLRAAMVSSVI